MYSLTEDYNYVISQLGALIVELGGEIEDVGTITLDDALILLVTTYPPAGSHPNADINPEWVELSRNYNMKSSLIRKWLYYRDLLSARMS